MSWLWPAAGRMPDSPTAAAGAATATPFRRLWRQLLAVCLADRSGGTLGRGDFLAFGGLAAVLFLALSLGIGLSGGIANNLALYVPPAAVLLAALANVSAKRLRHIGLPGWPALALAIVLAVASAVTMRGTVTAALLLLLVAGLLLVPGRRAASK